MRPLVGFAIKRGGAIVGYRVYDRRGWFGALSWIGYVWVNQ